MYLLHEIMLRPLSLIALLLLAGVAQAQTVTLRSTDGNLSLRGTLKEFDGQTYTIETGVGTIPVAAEGVICEGEGCPTIESAAEPFRLLTSRGVDQGLILSLVESFSLSTDTDIQIKPLGPERTNVVLSTPSGEVVNEIMIEPLATERVFEVLATARSAVAITNRPVDGAEIQLVAALGLGNLRSARSESVIALDAVVMIAQNSNPIRTVSEAEIAAIVSGQIDNWSQLGGPDGPINVYVPAETTETVAILESKVLAPADVRLGRNTVVLPNDARVADRVAADPFGFGVTTFSSLRSTRPLLIEGECGIWSAPTAFSIKSEEYPYAKRIYLYRSERELPPNLVEFVDFLSSDEAQTVIEDAGYVDQSVSAVTVNEQGLRFVSAMLPGVAEASLTQLQDMTKTLLPAERMSLTLRFETGAVDFDARARTDMQRLAEMINAGEMDRKEILMIGFTDSLGQASNNRDRSQERAASAAAQLGGLLSEDVASRARGSRRSATASCRRSVATTPKRGGGSIAV